MIRCMRLYDNPDGPRLKIPEMYEKPIVPEVGYRSHLRYAVAKTIRYLHSEVKMPRHPRHYTAYINEKNIVVKYKEIINRFKDTVLTDVKRINHITPKHVSDYFNILINNGAKKDAILTNAAALKKFFELLSRHNLVAYIDDNIPGWLCRVDGSPNKIRMEVIDD